MEFDDSQSRKIGDNAQSERANKGVPLIAIAIAIAAVATVVTAIVAVAVAMLM